MTMRCDERHLFAARTNADIPGTYRYSGPNSHISSGILTHEQNIAKWAYNLHAST